MPQPSHLSVVGDCTLCLLAAARRPASEEWKWVLLVVFLVLAPLVLILLLAAWREKKRTQALSQIAAGLGFEFFPTGDPVYFAGLDQLEFFGRGRQRKLWNLMRGASRSFEVNIFDYSYVTGSGRSSRTWKQTVVCLQSAALHLPEFSLSPKSFWNMIGAIFSHTEIEIDGHPMFTKIYQVRATDADAVRSAFDDGVLQFFEDHPGLSSQGANDRLLLYRVSKRAKPDEIPAFLEDGLKLLSSIQSTG